jgi:hypothetical protein
MSAFEVYNKEWEKRVQKTWEKRGVKVMPPILETLSPKRLEFTVEGMLKGVNPRDNLAIAQTLLEVNCLVNEMKSSVLKRENASLTLTTVPK